MTSPGALSNRQIARAAAVVLLGFLASGVLGLIRTAAFSSMFGAGPELDAFYTAQQIPELLFTLVAGGALGSSFIPVFARFMGQDDDSAAWALASSVMSLSATAALLLGLLLILLSPLFMPLLIAEVPPAYQALTVDLTQTMLLTTLIFSISGLLMGILNAHQNFLLPALALSMNNLGLIVGALVIAPMLSTSSGPFAYQSSTDANVYGLAFGAILGALLHLTVQLPGLRPIGARLRYLPNTRTAGTLEVMRLMLPRIFGLAVTRLNFLVSVFFANRMIAGSYTALNTAWFLTFFTLGILGQSVGTALFPSLAALAAANDMDAFRSRLSTAIRSVLFLAIPATVGLTLLGQPLIALLFERGSWTSVDTAATAWALGFFALGIAGHALLEILSRAFYALSDTTTPVLVGVASLLSNIVLSALFIQSIGDPESLAKGPFAGLALANSLTTLLEGLALWGLMRRRVGTLNDRHVLSGVLWTLLASLLMGVAVWSTVMLLSISGPLLQVIAGGTVGLLTFFGMALLLRLPEARSIPGLVLGRISR